MGIVMGLFRAVILALVAAEMLCADGVTGQWIAHVSGPRGQIVEIEMDLQADDSVLTGTVRDPEGEHPISSGTVDGDNISLSVVINRDGYQVVQRYRGTVEEDVIHFSLAVEDQHPKTASRSSPKTPPSEEFEAKRLG